MVFARVLLMWNEPINVLWKGFWGIEAGDHIRGVDNLLINRRFFSLAGFG